MVESGRAERGFFAFVFRLRDPKSRGETHPALVVIFFHQRVL